MLICGGENTNSSSKSFKNRVASSSGGRKSRRNVGGLLCTSQNKSPPPTPGKSEDISEKPMCVHGKLRMRGRERARFFWKIYTQQLAKILLEGYDAGRPPKPDEESVQACHSLALIFLMRLMHTFTRRRGKARTLEWQIALEAGTLAHFPWSFCNWNCFQFSSPFRIGRIRKYLNQSDTERLVHAIVTFKLPSGNSLLYGLPSTKISNRDKESWPLISRPSWLTLSTVNNGIIFRIQRSERLGPWLYFCTSHSL